MRAARVSVNRVQLEYTRDEVGVVKHKTEKSCGPTHLLKTSRAFCKADGTGCPKHSIADDRPCALYDRYTTEDVKIIQTVVVRELPPFKPTRIDSTVHDCFTFGFDAFTCMPLSILGREIMVGCEHLRSVADDSALVCGSIDLLMWDHDQNCMVPVEVKTTGTSYPTVRTEHVLQLRLYMEILIRQSQPVLYGLLVVVDTDKNKITVWNVPANPATLYTTQHGRKHALIKSVPHKPKDDGDLVK